MGIGTDLVVTVTTAPSPPAAVAPRVARNPGPSWGYRFFRWCDRLIPEAVFRPMRLAGTAVALAVMRTPRRHSREYLCAVFGRAPTRREVFRHFFAFTEALLLKLRVINGRPHRCDLAEDSTGYREWLPAGYPVLLGTFHIGPSDLLGFMLGSREHRLVHLVRLRVGNSHDTERLAAQAADYVRFVWVNDPRELLFALKNAAESGGAIAMQCDRLEFSARAEAFEFLGARRLFPFTIYELARLFQRPVILSFGVQESATRSVLHDSPVYRPAAAESREASHARAREHFQAFLRKLEVMLRAHPYLWFNFTPLNPPPPEDRP
jgi:predicted LPLAT superfamily acyltransferase